MKVLSPVLRGERGYRAVVLSGGAKTFFLCPDLVPLVVFFILRALKLKGVDDCSSKSIYSKGHVSLSRVSRVGVVLGVFFWVRGRIHTYK